MFTDFILNNQGVGEVGEVLVGARFDPGFLRPYVETHPNSPLRGQRVCTINSGKMIFNHEKGIYEPKYIKMRVSDLQNRNINSPVFNATSLRKEDWIQLDREIIRAARERMRAWADLSATNSFGGFNAMGKATLEYEAMSDPGEAVVDMDALSDARTDSPLFKLRSIPLPITHSDFWFSQRRVIISRNSGTPLDSTMGEAAGRRVGEKVEKTTIGIETGISYGTQTAGYGTHDGSSKVYGYINLPARLTKTNLTAPTGANPETTVSEILAMRNTMFDNKFYGPFMIYHSTDWDTYLDNDYARLGGNNASMTLRDRIRKIDGIQDVKRLDFLTPSASHAFTLVMVQMTSDVARAINGMDVTTVQWESLGGAKLNFKVMCIQVPQLRYDYNGVAAILHARTA